MASRNALLSLGEIVSLMMRSPNFQSLPLSSISAMVVPAVSSGQFMVARTSTEPDGDRPVGACLWARVSPEVDRRLSRDLDQQMRLAADDWKSGDIAWVVAFVGDQRIVTPMLERLQKVTLKGRPLKMRILGDDGVATVRALTAKPETEARPT